MVTDQESGGNGTGPRRASSLEIWRVAFRRVVKSRCPQCGRGRLFKSWAKLCERCATCGLVYRREQGAELGAMYLSATVNQAFAALVFLIIWWGTDWGLGLSLGVGVPIVLGFCYAFLPWSMGLWTAVEYAHDVGNREWWARPRRDVDPEVIATDDRRHGWARPPGSTGPAGPTGSTGATGGPEADPGPDPDLESGRDRA